MEFQDWLQTNYPEFLAKKYKHNQLQKRNESLSFIDWLKTFGKAAGKTVLDIVGGPESGVNSQAAIDAAYAAYNQPYDSNKKRYGTRFISKDRLHPPQMRNKKQFRAGSLYSS